MTKDEKIFTASLDDKIRRCDQACIATCTGFLDAARQTAAVNYLRGLGRDFMLYGGFEDAERRILVFLPEYMAKEDFPGSEEDPLCVLSVSKAPKAPALSHRDYLGSILALGIKRDVVGDIVVREDGAEIVILKEMGDFFLSSYTAAGHTPLKTEIKAIGDIDIPEPEIRYSRDTVASLRLDSVLASAFGLSRAKAADAVKAGLVFVNSIECRKTDAPVNEGDKLVIRGKGKAILVSIEGQSRKGRTGIKVGKYI